MSKNYMQEIKSRILASEDGSVFSTSDFADIAAMKATAQPGRTLASE